MPARRTRLYQEYARDFRERKIWWQPDNNNYCMENRNITRGDTSPNNNSAKLMQREINLQRIRDRAEKLKEELLNNLETQLRDVIDDFVQEIEMIERHGHAANGQPPQARTYKKGELADKRYVPRASVLTELLEINHIRTIYHIFVAILIVFSLNTMVYDFLDKGTIITNFDLISWTFGNFPTVMWLWFCMLMSTTVVVYPVFNYWASNRRPGNVYWMDYVWLAIYIMYQVVFLVVPIKVLHDNKLPPASSVVIATEQTRMMMKVHAFVRENVPRAISFKKTKSNDEEAVCCPDFSKYLYFLFAPTLVYRDNYPRSSHPVKWSYVFSNFAQVLACLFYMYYIFERFCVPVFNNFGMEPFSARRLILCVFGCMLPGTLVLFIGFFSILHSWLNAFAEMLRFADRLFYKDWWNSSNFSSYYRTWNVVVHDWLYSYIYKDIYKIAPTANRAAAMASVFLISALFHEYILAVSFGFCYPVLFLMFAGIGFGFIFLPNKGAPRSGNVFMWVALFIGTGLLMCLYSLEWYARQNCKPSSDSAVIDFLVPRSWTCDHIAKTAVMTT